jgi:hypothetical protein
MQLVTCASADLYGIDLEGVDLYRADLQDTTLYKANLRHAKLERADLSRADLRLADLNGANLLRAKLDGALLNRASIGPHLIQEDKQAYIAYVNDDRRLRDFALARQPNPSKPRYHLYPIADEEWEKDTIELEVCKQHVQARFVEARDIFLALEACFLQQSLTDDASWAHYNARRMQRRSYWPTHAAHCYPTQWPKRQHIFSPGTWFAALSYLGKWVVQSLYEITSGYGERPGRAIACLAVLFNVFTVLTFQYSDLGRGPGQNSWPDSLLFSLGALTGLGFDDLSPVNFAGKLIAGLEAAFGISFFALYMFTLGNRMGKG